MQRAQVFVVEGGTRQVCCCCFEAKGLPGFVCRSHYTSLPGLMPTPLMPCLSTSESRFGGEERAVSLFDRALPQPVHCQHLLFLPVLPPARGPPGRWWFSVGETSVDFGVGQMKAHVLPVIHANCVTSGRSVFRTPVSASVKGRGC